MKVGFKDKDGIEIYEPILSEFGLSQEDINKYEEQEKKYFKKSYQLKEELEEYDRKRYLWAYVVPFITLTVTSAFVMEANEGLGIFLFIMAFIISFALGKIFKKNEIEPNRDKYIDKDLEIKVNKYRTALIIYNNKKSQHDDWIRRQTKRFWRGLDGFQFEQEVGKLYQRYGYHVEVTKATGDGGIDIKMQKDGNNIAVQCKNHAKPVGPIDVRAFIGVLVSRQFNRGIFVSTYGLTLGAEKALKTSPVPIELVTLNDLTEMSSGSFNDEERTSEDTQEYTKKSIQIPKEKSVFVKVETSKTKEVIDPYIGSGVRVGKLVKLLYIEENEEYFLQIVEGKDAAPDEGKLSINSPVGSALIGKNMGDVISIKINGEEIKIIILEISNRGNNPFI